MCTTTLSSLNMLNKRDGRYKRFVKARNGAESRSEEIKALHVSPGDPDGIAALVSSARCSCNACAASVPARPGNARRDQVPLRDLFLECWTLFCKSSDAMAALAREMAN